MSRETSSLPLNWRIEKLESLTDKIGSGSTPRGGEAVYKSFGTPLIRSMNVHFSGFRPEGLVYIDVNEATKLRHVEVKAGDVLLNITGASIGRTTTAPKSMARARVNQHVCIIRPKKELLPNFLAYYLASPEEQARVMNVQVGATRQALTKSVIENWQIPLPPLQEQRRIVAEIEKQFTRLDAGVAALKRLQANLKRYRAAVLKAACEGRLLPGDARKWKQTTLEDVCAKVTDGDHQPPPKVPDGIPFLTIGNISSGRLDFSDTRFVPPEYFYRIKADRIPQTNDVLYSVVGATIGIPVLVTTERQFCFQRHIAMLKPSASILPKFLWLFMASPKTFREAWAKTTGSAQPTLPLKALRSLPISLPPLAEQTQIVAEVERRLSVVEELDSVVTANLQRATRLRQSILQKAFSGGLA